VIGARLDQPVPPLAVPGGEIPLDLESVIRRCLESESAGRSPMVIRLANVLADCRCAEGWSEAKAARWWQEHPEQILQEAAEIFAIRSNSASSMTGTPSYLALSSLLAAFSPART